MIRPHKTVVLGVVLVLAFTLAIGGIYLVSAETGEEESLVSGTPFGKFHRGFVGPMFGDIDAELRAEMQETIQAMREEGTSFEDIWEYIQGFLEENGIEPQRPEFTSHRPEFTPHRLELTEEEIEAYKQLHEDVKAYAEKRAAELGLELPKNGFFGGRGIGFHGFMRGSGRMNSYQDCPHEIPEDATVPTGTA